MKEFRPKRLQGTDGIRGEVAAADDRRLTDLTPVDAFLRRGLVSPPFIELYCYAFVNELIDKNLASPADKVIVGYDPRDRDRTLVNAALNGVAKAGAVPVDAGVLPTPAVGIHMVASGASGAVVVTASHNPPDQNGIKLFMPGIGLKLYPSNDEQLTKKIYDLENENLAGLTPIHQPVDGAEKARSDFVDFFQSSFNSWIAAGDFSDTVLIIDSANGALAGIAKDVFERFGFRYIEEVGAATDGSVNINCGAALLEGHSEVGSDYISDTGVDFRTVDLIQSIFHHGRSNREDISAGRLRVSGAAFDADGDRFYRLEYNPFRDAILILSGDETAYHQAAFIRQMLGSSYSKVATFATTVESDLNVSAAAEELGFVAIQTGVGDKWLLWEATCHLLSSYWETLLNSTADIDLAMTIEERGEEFDNCEHADAEYMIRLLNEAEKWAGDNDLNLVDLAHTPEMLNFIVGGEETGHTVTAGRVECIDGSQRIVYFGNGLKSAVNTFAATRELAKELHGEEYYRRLHQPFPPGFKRTIPVYYTDKSLLQPGIEIRRELEEKLLMICRRRFEGRFTPELLPRAEEPEMIYIGLSEPGNDKAPRTTNAAIFVRNSGTEDKTSVYLRGNVKDENDLMAIGGEAALLAGSRLKRADHPYASAELAVMRRLEERGPCRFQDLADLLSDVNPERLLLEMNVKEGYLTVIGDKLDLSDFGRRILEAINRGGQ